MGLAFIYCLSKEIGSMENDVIIEAGIVDEWQLPFTRRFCHFHYCRELVTVKDKEDR